MFWKTFYEYTGEIKFPGFDKISPEYLEDLLEHIHYSNAPCSAKDLLTYLIGRELILRNTITVEQLVRLAYAPSIRSVGDLSGEDFRCRDREHCTPELMELLGEAARFQRNILWTDYDFTFLYQTALFEICRRNDGNFLRFYLRDFLPDFPDDGFKKIYDAAFDYYIYMYLPDWTLLKKYNWKNHDPNGELPGTCSKPNDCCVSINTQKEMLDVLIRQAEKSNVPRPEVLEILFEYGTPSFRSIFPVKELPVHSGIEFSSRGSDESHYSARLLLHYGEKELAPEQCIDAEELSKLISHSGCGLPVNCTCGDPGCGGIKAVSESWVIGNKVRLYIPVEDSIYYLAIDDRDAFQSELLLMMQHMIRMLKCHSQWQKTGKIPADHGNENGCHDFLPQAGQISDLQKLCKEIRKSMVTMDDVHIVRGPEYECRLIVNGIDIGQGYTIHDAELIRALTGSGDFYPLTCSCGEHGCAGIWHPVHCQKNGDVMVWHKKQPAPVSMITFYPKRVLEELADVLRGIYWELAEKCGGKPWEDDFPHGPYGTSLEVLKKDLDQCLKYLEEM